MSKRFTFSAFLAFSLMFLSFHAHANVLIEDTNENSEIGTLPDLLLSGTIGTGSGNPGDYVIFACSVPNDFEVPFNPPTPDIWEELENTICPDFFCGLGIWAGFVTDSDSEEITCNSVEPVTVFVAGSMRYRGVDPNNPIIDVECDGGIGTVLTAPSIETEAGSQVLRVFTDGLLTETLPTDSAVQVKAEIEDSWQVTRSSLFGQTLSASGFSRLQTSAGPTGTSQLIVGSERGWRACTIGIRMENIRNIPTLSGWGLIALAAAMGVFGAFYAVRRRTAADA